MISGECFENKWLYMKYIGKYLSAEILLTREYIALKHNFFFLQITALSVSYHFDQRLFNCS